MKWQKTLFEISFALKLTLGEQVNFVEFMRPTALQYKEEPPCATAWPSRDHRVTTA